MVDKISGYLTVILALVSLATIIFYAGYNYRTLEALRKVTHELTGWKQGLIDILDIKYVRRELYNEHMENIESSLTEIKTNMERRAHTRS